jgi:hypothetical protein
LVAFRRAFIGHFQGELKGKGILRIQMNYGLIFGPRKELMDLARINFGIFGPRKELMDWIPIIL